jgi:predicted transposase YbfD/YdcC
MGCQKNIAKKICENGADYVLALKGNQESLADEVENYFIQAEAIDFEGLSCDGVGSKEIGHGRIEKREIYVTEDIDWLPQKDQWLNLKSIIMVKSERLLPGQQAAIERRYYISSLSANALRVASAIRKHWGIENNLHRQLDVNFSEDASQANTGNAAENLAVFRRLALNILGSGKGLLERRKRAAWEEQFLTGIIMKFFIKSF